MVQAKNNKTSAPYFPAPYTEKEIRAIQALQRGDASAEQQQHALKWIVEVAAATYDMPYRPGGEDGRRDTDFACGRAFVGHNIVKMLKLKPSNFDKPR